MDLVDKKIFIEKIVTDGLIHVCKECFVVSIFCVQD